MEENPTFLLVVAAAIRRADGAILLQQRPAGKRHGGFWEFPGGKVDPGETPAAALCREITEELAITLDAEVLDPVGFAETPAEDGLPGLLLLLYTADAWTGSVHGCEGQQWGWYTSSQAKNLPLAPMDRILLKKLAD